MVVLVLQLHWRTVALLVLDVVAHPERHGDVTLAQAALLVLDAVGFPEWNDNAALPLVMSLAVLVRVDALVLDVVALPEWHGDGALVLAATAVLMLLLSLVVARSLGGMIVCALALSLLQVAMVERQKRLVMPGELVHVLVVGPERLVEEQKL